MDKVFRHIQITCLYIYIYIYIYIYMSRGKAIRPLDLVKNAVDTTVFSYMHRESMGMEK